MSENIVEKKYEIPWDQIELSPSIQIKEGISRKVFKLNNITTHKRENICFINDLVDLRGKWDNTPGFGSKLNLRLTNISKNSIRLCRVVFPAENGLDDFLKDFTYRDISFLRNGYQSWSTSRSYKVADKPLRPWLQLVSLASSNLANLPSNTPGNLSSEMFSVITDTKKNRSFLVGQCSNFNQFFYIRLIIHKRENRKSHFELVFDFGRKMIRSNESVELDGIVMARGNYIELQRDYFEYIRNSMNLHILKKNIKGWSTWYYYYNKITPEIIYENTRILKSKNIDVDYIQIDDGYQKCVGDWTDLNPQFDGKMREISGRIKSAGYIPGIWIAPFIADVKSRLVNNYPDYILRTEYGRRLIAGYNPLWKGKFYVGLDVTNPRFEEYIRNVIELYTKEWGFKLLKLDFLYGACLRGANHNNYGMSRTEILKYGMKIIKESAGKDVILVGCGMPLSCGIGTVDIMRIGPDTATYWKKIVGSFLQTGAMVGVRNSIRNTLVRSMMNKRLWINDPDCLILRKNRTKLNYDERLLDINSILLSGAAVFYSDNFNELDLENYNELDTIKNLSDELFRGESIPLDIMETEIPEIYYNTAGYIGIFNFSNIKTNKILNLTIYKNIIGRDIKILKDIWTNKLIYVNNGILYLKGVRKHQGFLFKIVE